MLQALSGVEVQEPTDLVMVYRMVGVPSSAIMVLPDQQPWPSRPPGVGCRAMGSCRQCTRLLLLVCAHTIFQSHADPP